MDKQHGHLLPVSDSFSNQGFILSSFYPQKVPLLETKQVVSELWFSLISSFFLGYLGLTLPISTVFSDIICFQFFVTLSIVDILHHKVRIDVWLLANPSLALEHFYFIVDFGDFSFDIDDFIDARLDYLLEFALQISIVMAVFSHFSALLSQHGFFRKDRH